MSDEYTWEGTQGFCVASCHVTGLILEVRFLLQQILAVLAISINIPPTITVPEDMLSLLKTNALFIMH